MDQQIPVTVIAELQHRLADGWVDHAAAELSRVDRQPQRIQRTGRDLAAAPASGVDTRELRVRIEPVRRVIDRRDLATRRRNCRLDANLGCPQDRGGAQRLPAAGREQRVDAVRGRAHDPPETVVAGAGLLAAGVVVCCCVVVVRRDVADEAGAARLLWRCAAGCLGAVAGRASGRGAERPWRCRLAVLGVGDARAVVAAAALEWPEKPRAATAMNASSNAVAAPASPRLVYRRRLSALSRRWPRSAELGMLWTVPEPAKRSVT